MEFRSFSFLLWTRILLLICTTILCVLFVISWDKIPIAVTLSIILFFQGIELHRFMNSTNRKLSHFLESVQYSDFVTTFTEDNKLGKTFRGLNKSFNKVLDAFRKTRIEKEEHLHYLNLIVDHVETGLISFNEDGKIDVVNKIAHHLLGIKGLRHLDELKKINSDLYKIIWDLEAGAKTTFVVRENVHLAIQATQFVRRGEFIRLIALHNIHAELAQKELDSWQNLLSVLRHEIMNSMTPISSLSSTMKSIIEEDLTKKDNVYELDENAKNDISESLETIASRSNGLITFIQGYRDYTSLPSPKITVIKAKSLIDHVVQLMKQDDNHISINTHCTPEDLEINADEHLIEQVLINLVKNAKEAFPKNHPSPKIIINAYKEHQFKIIEVEDNGVGIVSEAIEKIFIPFYTNKKSGSGIGLSVSKQIMNLHNGSLKVFSEPEVKTVFKLVF